MKTVTPTSWRRREKRMTLVVILDDDPALGDLYAMDSLSSRSNDELSLKMAETYGSAPGMELQSVLVEDME